MTADHAWSSAPDEVARQTGSDLLLGLDPGVAADRAAAHPNVLPEPTRRGALALAGDQLRDTFVLLLLGSCVLAAAVGDLKDTAVIAAVVVANTFLGVRQELRAERALSDLRSLTRTTARVVRGGTALVLPTEALAVGDLLVVAAGDLVPADARVASGDRLAVDEALLTGESVAAAKDPEPVSTGTPVADRSCMLHAGSSVVRGSGTALVTQTGADTAVGRIAESVRAASAPPTPLQRQLARLGREVALIAVVLCSLVVLIGLLQGEPWETMLVTGTSLAVAAVPESLPAVVAVSLALGAQRMARRSAVVRSLPAIESLGAVTVIATDKTGTLTEGRLTVASTWAPDGDDTELVRALVLCNDAALVEDGFAGDPLEAALLVLAAERVPTAAQHRDAWPRAATEPFDPRRRRMTTTHQRGDDVLVVCKGAPEVVLPLVTDPGLRVRAEREAERMAGAGLRVLAVAHAHRGTLPRDTADAEHDLALTGLVALHDPLRATAAEAVASCRRAGIVPVLVTGDHLGTAVAVAEAVGIATERVATGVAELDLSRPLPTVFARTAPEEKLDVVVALQQQGHVVAMTGDGVNDAPALRRADVGVAMGASGTEVARQAADVVLLDDDLATLVAAVAEGRRVFRSIQRFLLYAMSGGTAELIVMLVGPAFGLALPLLPAQVLWVNLLTHGPPGVALGAGAPSGSVLDQPPRDPRRPLLDRELAVSLLLLGGLIAAVSLISGLAVRAHDGPWQTAVFLTIAVQQLAVALALTRRGHDGFEDRPVLLAVLLSAVLLVAAIAWSPLQSLLQTRALDLGLVAALLPACALAPLAARVVNAARQSARATRLSGPSDPR